MPISRVAYIYWSVIMMVSTVAIACLYDPVHSVGTLALRFDAGRWIAMLTSPYLLLCVAGAAFGIYRARKVWAENEGAFTDTDKMLTIWFLMNACWFHTGCDILSGLFQVMPNLTEAYAGSNAAHLQPMHHPDRAYLDMVYWFELFVELPFSIAVFKLYLARSPWRPPVEIFLCGLHIVGTVAFYLPNLLMGRVSNPVLSNVDRVVGAVWIVIPLLVAWRDAKQIVASVGEARPLPA